MTNLQTSCAAAGGTRRALLMAAVAAVLGLCRGPIMAADAPAHDGTVVQRAVQDDAPGRATEAVLFYMFATATLGSGLGICLSRNIVRMAVYLFFTLGAMAVLYFLLLANFIAVIQLIVYAGGTLVLLIFGVMLTSKSPWARFDIKRYEMIAAGLVCIVFGIGLLAVVTGTAWPVQTGQEITSPTVATFGQALLTTYLVPFEAVSVLLLVVMIGAAFLARQEKD